MSALQLPTHTDYISGFLDILNTLQQRTSHPNDMKNILFIANKKKRKQ